MPDWKMFSADDHVDLPYLPGDLWTARVPRKFRDRVPQLVENAEEWHWEADGEIFGARYRYDNYTSIRFGKSTTPVTQEPGRWRPTTPELRLEDMDRLSPPHPWIPAFAGMTIRVSSPFRTRDGVSTQPLSPE